MNYYENIKKKIRANFNVFCSTHLLNMTTYLEKLQLESLKKCGVE